MEGTKTQKIILGVALILLIIAIISFVFVSSRVGTIFVILGFLALVVSTIIGFVNKKAKK